MTALVLLSGGYDSAYCAIVAAQRSNAHAVFVDYGQAYAAEERAASTHVAAHLGIPLQELRLELPGATLAVVPRRNAQLVAAALGALPYSEELYFGCRNPFWFADKYGDSNWLWGRRVGAVFDVAVRMPCLCLPKRTITDRIEATGLQLRDLYSTEAK